MQATVQAHPELRTCPRCARTFSIDLFPFIKNTTQRRETCADCSPGGMCKNAFGGHARLDKCNVQGPSLVDGLLLDVLSNLPGERSMWVTVVQQAVNSYLFWGLGANGTSAEEFWSSVEFLFNCRASKPETWEHSRRRVTTYKDETLGKRVTVVENLPDDVLKMGCLDTIWDLGDWPFPLDVFLDMLQAERRKLVQLNKEQIEKYLALLNRRSFVKQVQKGQMIPLKLLSDDLENVLCRPELSDLAELTEYIPHVRRTTKPPLGSLPARKPLKKQARRKKSVCNYKQGGLFGFEVNSDEPAYLADCSSAGMSA